jgi:hypothetical protein
MDELQKIAKSIETDIAKSVSTTDLAQVGTAGKIVTAQNLDPVIAELGNRMTPFYDAVSKVDGFGSGVTYNQNEAFVSTTTNLQTAAYGDGLIPSNIDTKFNSVYAPYKSLGWKGTVTGLAQAMGQARTDLYASEISIKTRALIHAIEFMAFWGSVSDDALRFDGLDTLITDNVVDAAGAVVSKELLDRAMVRIGQKGGMATHIFTSMRVQADINNLYNTNNVQVSLDATGQVDLGLLIPRANTQFGRLPIVGNFFLNPGNTYTLPNGASSTPLGANTSTIFVLNMDYINLNFLQRPTLEPLGKTADKEEFFIKSYLTLVNKAQSWCAKIINVKDNTLT